MYILCVIKLNLNTNIVTLLTEKAFELIKHLYLSKGKGGLQIKI